MNTLDVEFIAWPIVPRGGQHVGISNGVLAAHLPTGLAFVGKEHRSMRKNKEDALAALELLLPLWGTNG